VESGIFDGEFLTSEISQASCIRDKGNRKSVIRILKMINIRIRSINIKDYQNGILIFAGILENGNEIFEVISPPTPISNFYYKCDKYFHTYIFNELFVETPKGYIVFIDGTQTIVYQYNAIFKKVKSINAMLIKNHKKGGSSQGRFDRLSEESRQTYITRVVDFINQTIIDSNINFVFGSEDMKSRFLQNSSLKPKFYTESLYFSFDEHTIHDNYFKNIMKIDNNFDDKIELIYNLIQTNPDILLFSMDEINENIDNVEFVLCIKQDLIDGIECIKLNINNKYYGKLKDYNIIAKLYYVV